MNCQFEKIDSEHVRCKVCGLTVHAKDPTKVFTGCPGEPRKFPPHLKQVKNYAKALTKHVATGMETRTDEEVIQILQLCETCEHYSDGRCMVCGCRLNNGSNAFTNKLRMKSLACPKGMWS